MFFHRLRKLCQIIVNPSFLSALGKGAAAGTEHVAVLEGLNAKFALAARKVFPRARIHSFEPLEEPGQVYEKIFANDPHATLHSFAIGREKATATMHITKDDDSSSLLPVTQRQSSLFPGATEMETRQVNVLPLSQVLGGISIPRASLLKIDVQGLELEVLRGCEDMLQGFSKIYVECSFVELYIGQALAHEVIAFLHQHGFRLTGVYNVCYDSKGIALQADFLFTLESQQ
jgi:FkbM family methyltransferase